jgi:hypothetical protein
MFVAFPSGLPEGPIVLDGFCWELVKFEPRSIYDSKIGSEGMNDKVEEYKSNSVSTI